MASFISLVNQKEQKTSEFRQSWIDALREDLAHFLGVLEAIGLELAEHLKQENVSGAEFLERTAGRYESARGTLARILLRLNPDEHHNLEQLLLHADETLHREAMDVAALRALRKSIIDESRRVLKKEWKRVKSGERTFRFTEVGAGILVVALAAAAWSLYGKLTLAAQQGAAADVAQRASTDPW